MIALLKNPLVIALLALLAVLLLCLGLIAHGASKERERQEAKTAIAVAEALQTDAAAATKSTEELATEAAKISEIERKLEDEVAKTTDGPPTAADVIYSCRKLQRHGVDTSDIPACPPSESGAGADTI